MKSRSKALLWVILIFLIGTLFGATSTYLVMQATTAADLAVAVPKESRSRSSEGREHSPEDFLERLSTLLSLDAEQREQLRLILEKNHRRYSQIDEEARRKNYEVRRQGREELRAILRPDQLKKFDEYLEERRRKQEKDSGGPGGRQ